MVLVSDQKLKITKRMASATGMRGAPRIGFVTCADMSHSFPSEAEPFFSEDCAAAAQHIRAQGAVVVPLIWDDPDFFREAQDCDLVVVRSPWDYMETLAKRQGFVSWLNRLHAEKIRCENPPDVMLWNMDKQYLGAFAKAGISIVPTRFVGPEESFDLAQYFNTGGAFVLKPCVSAGAHDTFKFLTQDEARLFQVEWERIRPQRHFMVQPFLHEITERGEWSCVFFDGQYSHSVHKLPGQGQWLVQGKLGGSVLSKNPPGPIRAMAERVANSLSREIFSEPMLYARIDVIDSFGGALLSEVKLIEPELFFLERTPGGSAPNASATESFWRAVQSRLASVSPSDGTGACGLGR